MRVLADEVLRVQFEVVGLGHSCWSVLSLSVWLVALVFRKHPLHSW